MSPTEQNLADLELERRTLGSCLLEPRWLLELDLTDADFWGEANRLIWQQLLYLHAEGGAEAVGTLQLRNRLADLGKLQSAGGDDYLLALTDLIPTRPDTGRLKRLARLRTLRGDALRVVAAAESGDLERASAAAADVQLWATEARDAQIVTGSDCAVAVFDDLMGTGKRVLRIHPGLELMAEVVGDMTVGSLTVIGGATNTGKSSVALEMIVRAALRTVGCGYVSREDPKVLIGGRLLGMLSGISAWRIERRQLDRERDWPRLSHAAAELQRLGEKLLVDVQVGGTELDVCAAMTRMAQRGAKLIVVDYLQALEFSGRGEDRRNEIRLLTSRIKAHAARLDVALVMLSQLSRPPKGEEGREPTKHDLKEAGDVENAAENIVLMWRTEEDDFAPLHLKLAKGKSGGLGQRWAMQRNRQTGRLEEVR